MPSLSERCELKALQAMFPLLVEAPDPSDQHFAPSDALRVAGPFSFVSGGEGSCPQLECRYEIKIIVPRAFPGELPRVYSVDGAVPRDYHTNPVGDFCLGPLLQLRGILREDPTLLGYVSGAVVPYLYRHRYTVLHDGREPPGWGELAHGVPGLLEYYGRLLGVDDFHACLGLLRHAGARQRTGRYSPCPCGSRTSLNACHYQILAELRRSLGRDAISRACLELEKYGPP